MDVEKREANTTRRLAFRTNLKDGRAGCVFASDRPHRQRPYFTCRSSSRA